MLLVLLRLEALFDSNNLLWPWLSVYKGYQNLRIFHYRTNFSIMAAYGLSGSAILSSQWTAAAIFCAVGWTDNTKVE